LSTDVEEYEFEEIYTREQIADLLESIAEQIRKGFLINIPAPIKKDGKIKVTISELITLGISIRLRKNRSNIKLELTSEPTELPEEEVEEQEQEEEKEEPEIEG